MDPYDRWKLSTPWEGRVEHERLFEFEIPIMVRGVVEPVWYTNQNADEDEYYDAQRSAVEEEIQKLLNRAQLGMGDIEDGEIDLTVIDVDWANLDYYEYRPKKKKTGTTG